MVFGRALGRHDGRAAPPVSGVVALCSAVRTRPRRKSRPSGSGSPINWRAYVIPPGEDGLEQALLAREVVQQPRLAQAGLVGHVAERALAIAGRGEDLDVPASTICWRRSGVLAYSPAGLGTHGHQPEPSLRTRLKQIYRSVGFSRTDGPAAPRSAAAGGSAASRRRCRPDPGGAATATCSPSIRATSAPRRGGAVDAGPQFAASRGPVRRA